MDGPEDGEELAARRPGEGMNSQGPDGIYPEVTAGVLLGLCSILKHKIIQHLRIWRAHTKSWIADLAEVKESGTQGGVCTTPPTPTLVNWKGETQTGLGYSSALRLHVNQQLPPLWGQFIAQGPSGAERSSSTLVGSSSSLPIRPTVDTGLHVQNANYPLGR